MINLDDNNPNTNNSYKENLMTILEHLVNYIKDLSMSSKDLFEEFSEGLVKCDNFPNELGQEFSKIIKSVYFDKLCNAMNLAFSNSLVLDKNEEKGIFTN